MKASRSAWRMWLPCEGRTSAKSMPNPRARCRTAGDARAFECDPESVRPELVEGLLFVSNVCGVKGGGSTGSARTGIGSGSGSRSDSGSASVTGSVTSPSFPAPSTSITTSGAPMASMSPASPASSTTVPETGLSISTVALSVMTSASLPSSWTRSPTPTCQATISASAMPSPMSGRRKV